MHFGPSRATGPLGLVAFILLVSVSNAATYYIATTGNDSHSGSASTPWRTLQKAANAAKVAQILGLQRKN